MTQTSRSRSIRNLVIFSVAVLLSGWAGVGAESLLGSSAKGLGQLIWIVTPVVLSLLLRTFGGDGWRDFGLRPAFRGNGRWYAVSLLAYPVIVAIVLTVGTGVGAASLSPATMTDLAKAVPAALAAAFFKNLFEEFAWRGYLAPKVYALRGNDYVAHLIVGAVWALWHLPYYFVMLGPAVVREQTTLSLGGFLPLALIGPVVSSIAYGEIRLRTNSVWPAVLMHTMDNALFSLLMTSGVYHLTGMPYLASPVGLVSVVLMAVLGVGVHRVHAKRALAA